MPFLDNPITSIYPSTRNILSILFDNFLAFSRLKRLEPFLKKGVSGELTYGLERLAMYILGKDHVMDIPYTRADSEFPLKYGDLFYNNELQYSRWNFDVADPDVLFRHFIDAEEACKMILSQSELDPKSGKEVIMAFPAYDQCIKASHIFNLLDARGVISVVERQAYISRVRGLARVCGEAFLKTNVSGN